MLARFTVILYFATLISCSPIDNAKPMESYQSPDGSIRLTIHQTDNQFILRNGTEEVGLIKVETATTASASESNDHGDAKTTKSDVLKATSTEVAKGTTEATTTSSVSSTEAISRMTAVPAGGTKLTSVAVVTPNKSESIQTTTAAVTSTSTAASTTTEDNKSMETEEINDKIKEVEAIPVILAVRV